MRFTVVQYDRAIEALRAARKQIAPEDGFCFLCRICADAGHQAWECGHNPLLAMATCEEVARHALGLHVRLDTIEEKMNDSDQSEALADWREDVRALLHHLAGYDRDLGSRVGPACFVVPQEEAPL